MISSEEIREKINKIVGENSNDFLNEVQLIQNDESLCFCVSDLVRETYMTTVNDSPEREGIGYAIAYQAVLKIIKDRQQSKKQTLFLLPEERECAANMFAFVKSLMDCKFNYNEFYKSLCSGICLPLELLWKIHESGIMPIEIYFTKVLERPQIVAEFSRNIVNLCCMEYPVENISCRFIPGILCYIVTNAFAGADNKDNTSESGIEKVSRIMVDCILKRIIACEVKKTSESKVSSITTLWECSTVKKTVLHSFSNFALKFILSYNPSIKVSQALSEQQNWTFKSAPCSLVSVIKKVISELKLQEVSSALHRALEAQEVNWKSLLIFVSTYLICFKEASSCILGVMDQLLSDAFKRLQSDHLFSVFLLARQATFEGPPVFPLTYSDWFHKSFGDCATTLANSPRSFVFLMKFLTDLVPHEQTQYLKVHLDRPPYVVSRCKLIFTDYVNLVKTRLSDLRISLSGLGLFDCPSADRISSKQSGKEQVSEEINKVLLSFENTGRIPSTVLEASIFRKPYFCGQFLPVLLTARLLPDVPDTKMKFIDALNNAGKIPTILYGQYQSSCSKEAEKLFEGLEIDESFDKDFLSPEEQLNEILEGFHLRFEILKGNSNCSLLLHNTFSEQYEKLQETLRQISQGLNEDNSIVILADHNENSPERKVTEKLLDSYIHFSNVIENVEYSLLTALDLISVLLPLSSFHQALYQTIWDKIILCKKTSDDPELLGLCMCVLRIGVMPLQYPPVIYDVTKTEPCLFPRALFSALPVTNKRQLFLFLRISSLYLHLATQAAEDCEKACMSTSAMLPSHIPCVLLKKFQFSTLRLVPQNENCPVKSPLSTDELSFTVKLLQSNIVGEWIAVNHLKFHEWCKYEADIIPDEDHFEVFERSEYLHWYVHCYYLMKPELIESEGSLYKSISSCLFRLLLSSHKSQPSFSQMLCLLQGLVSSLSCDFVKDSTIPWLLQEFLEVVNNANQIPLETCERVNKICRIIYALPPVLLFTDSPWYICSGTGLRAFENIINNYLRYYCTENGFLVPTFFYHITKAMILIFKIDCNEGLAKDFINNCPLILSSLIYHWNFVQPIIMSNVSKTKNYFSMLLYEIQLLTSWAVTFLTESEPSKPPIFTFLPNWAIGLIVANNLHNNQRSNTSFHLLEDQLYQSSSQFYIAIETVRNASKDYSMYPPKQVISFIRSMFHKKKNTNCLDPRLYSQGILKNVVSPMMWKLFPSVTLRALVEVFSKEEIIQVDSDIINSWLILLLLNLKECNKFYDDLSITNAASSSDVENCQFPKKISGGGNSPTETDQKNCIKIFGIVKALDFSFIFDMTKRLKEIISIIPSNTLKAISHEAVECCGEEMQLFVYQKIGKKCRY